MATPITRQQMLDQMGLKDPQHTLLVKKFKEFYDGLPDPEQKKVVQKTMPQLAQAAKTFSGSVQPDDLKNAAGPDAQAAGFWGFALSNPQP